MQTRRKRIFLNFLSAVLVTFFMVMCFFAIVFGVFKVCYYDTTVVGHSMYPTLNSSVSAKESGDTVYINRYSGYTNGDIVVADATRWGLSNGSVYYIIKRLIGCPGDTIKIKSENGGYVLYVNGEPLKVDGEIYYKKDNDGETSILNYYGNYLSFFDKYPDNVIEDEEGDRCIILHENEYFLMGDNWSGSDDCILYGVIYESEMVGRVDIVIAKADKNYWTLFKEIMCFLFA